MDGTTEMRHVTARYRHALLLDYAERFRLPIFIETGTCEGDTLAALQEKFQHLYSIELSNHYFQRAKIRFAKAGNITLIFGDSPMQLEKLLPRIHSPVLFWLDAHPAGELTAQGPHPLLSELKTILDSKVTGVILADDMNPGELTEKAMWLVDLYPAWTQEWKDQILRVIQSPTR